MSIFTRPILEVNLNNLIENYKVLKKMSGKAIAAAVLKDDAYGIGASAVAEVLYKKGGCKHFFVAHAIEGEKIRKKVGESEIFVLQGIGQDCLDSFKNAKLIPVINSAEMLKFWQKNKVEGIHPAIQIETGLNRLGFREEDLKSLKKEELASFSLVMSHLACADNNAHFMNKSQFERFNELKAKFFPKTRASLSASDGVFLGKDFCFDMVRLGAAMYGINTTSYRENIMKSVVLIKAPVLEIADINEGEYVGYSASYQARGKRRIAIVSIGYGDGLPRSLSNIGKVFYKGAEAKIIGRVSMDNIICDITDIKGLKIGDFVNILDDKYTVDEMGFDAGTIGYEILSRIGKGMRFVRKV